jgi:hypothetical protein
MASGVRRDERKSNRPVKQTGPSEEGPDHQGILDPVRPFGSLAALSAPPNEQGPRLCVPASRRVCLCRGQQVLLTVSAGGLHPSWRHMKPRSDLPPMQVPGGFFLLGFFPPAHSAPVVGPAPHSLALPRATPTARAAGSLPPVPPCRTASCQGRHTSKRASHGDMPLSRGCLAKGQTPCSARCPAPTPPAAAAASA